MVAKTSLEIRDLVVRYGTVEALHGVSLRVRQGEVVALLGANGAGKSTALASVSGLVRRAEGSVRFEGKPLDAMTPERIVREGLGLVPEGRRVFASLTVAQNMRLGGIPLGSRKSYEKRQSELFELFPRLRDRAHQAAGTLSGGEQQMLAIARALMARPRLLLLDEPSLGLAPIVVKRVFELIKRLRASGITMLLVEQNVRLALEVADRAYVLTNGRIVREQPAEEMLRDQDLAKLYFSAREEA